MAHKMAAPVFFGVIFILCIAAYALIALILPIPALLKIWLGIVIMALSAAMVYVILQRKKELQEEDKDDLSQY